MLEGQHDFKGFTATHESALSWCRELFQHHWDEAEKRRAASLPQVEYERPTMEGEPSESITVVGQDRREADAQAVQEAVDNFDEVILKGTFNFGSSMVEISRSVVVRGEGREGDIPGATIYKKGWSFPFMEFDSVFKVNGKNAKVSIENMHFTDFNHVCIWGVQAESLDIKRNRITLMTGYGRGMAYGAFGDVVIGVWIRSSDLDVFDGRVSIEENYIDFARGGAFGGFLSRDGLEEDPEYRPDLFNHEYYMGFGVAIHQASGDVNIENNVIRNTNARGVAVTGCLQTADIWIRHNTIESDVYGSYPFSSPEAGAGILAQSAWGFPSPGFNVEIEDNTLKLERLNYSGIKVLGPVMDREKADKLRGGKIWNNRITLRKGYEGIHIRKCDDFEVIENTLTGDAYYGIRVSGRRSSREQDLMSLNNSIQDNDMSGFEVRGPDSYSDNHKDGRMFAESPEVHYTAHIWLDRYSVNNSIKARADEKVINQGKENKIECT